MSFNSNPLMKILSKNSQHMTIAVIEAYLADEKPIQYHIPCLDALLAHYYTQIPLQGETPAHIRSIIKQLEAWKLERIENVLKAGLPSESRKAFSSVLMSPLSQDASLRIASNPASVPAQLAPLYQYEEDILYNPDIIAKNDASKILEQCTRLMKIRIALHQVGTAALSLYHPDLTTFLRAMQGLEPKLSREQVQQLAVNLKLPETIQDHSVLAFYEAKFFITQPGRVSVSAPASVKDDSAHHQLRRVVGSTPSAPSAFPPITSMPASPPAPEPASATSSAPRTPATPIQPVRRGRREEWNDNRSTEARKHIANFVSKMQSLDSPHGLHFALLTAFNQTFPPNQDLDIYKDNLWYRTFIEAYLMSCYMDYTHNPALREAYPDDSALFEDLLFLHRLFCQPNYDPSTKITYNPRIDGGLPNISEQQWAYEGLFLPLNTAMDNYRQRHAEGDSAMIYKVLKLKHQLQADLINQSIFWPSNQPQDREHVVTVYSRYIATFLEYNRTGMLDLAKVEQYRHALLKHPDYRYISHRSHHAGKKVIAAVLATSLLVGLVVFLSSLTPGGYASAMQVAKHMRVENITQLAVTMGALTTAVTTVAAAYHWRANTPQRAMINTPESKALMQKIDPAMRVSTPNRLSKMIPMQSMR